MNVKKFITVFIVLSIVLLSRVSSGISSAQEPTVPEVSPTPTPAGQAIRLDLLLPGIGSEGGNLEPRHPEREVRLYFFNPDINAENTKTRPIGSYKATLMYDGNPDSPAFGSFVNEFSLDGTIKEGEYQIVVKTSQSLSKLIRTNPGDIGGSKFEIRGPYSQQIVISAQELLTGDIHPSPFGDNVMDVNDYNALVSCFGSRADSDTCEDKAAADLDDNGIVDGIDYNLMFSSFRKLLDAGLPVPSFIKPSVTPKPSVTKKPAAKPTAVKSNTEETKVKESGGATIAVVGIILIAGTIAIVLFIRKKKPDFFSAFLRKNKKTEAVSADPNDAPSSDSSSPSNEIVDRDFFVKQQTIDENKVTVLILTDDNGPMLGYYKGGEVKEGFAHVKGTMKKDGNKVYVEVSEIVPSDAF